MRFGHPLHDVVRRALPPVRRDRAAAAARQEDRLLEQRLPRRRLADVVRLVGRRAGLPGLPVAGPAGRSAATSATSPGAITATGWPTSSATTATTARTTTTTRASTRCRSSTAWTRSSGARTSRSRERWRLDLPDEHRADLPRGRELPAAHGRRPQHQVHPHLRAADRPHEGRGLRRRADVRRTTCRTARSASPGAGRHRRRHAHVRLVRRQRPRGADARQAGGLLPAARVAGAACAARSPTTSTSCRS